MANQVETHIEIITNNRDRASVFFRWLLVLPVVILISLFNPISDMGLSTLVIMVPVVLTILIRQVYPSWVLTFNHAILEFAMRIASYALFLTDKYPTLEPNSSVAVLLPDVLVLDKVERGDYFSFSKMMRAWEETGEGQIMVEQVGMDSVENYGVVDLGEAQAHAFVPNKVLGFVEKPVPKEAPSDLAILGRYILPPEIWNVLEGVEQGVGGEIQLTDALDQLLTKSTLKAFLTDAQIFDCGNKNGFLGANIAVGSRNPDARRYLQKLVTEIWNS